MKIDSYTRDNIMKTTILDEYLKDEEFQGFLLKRI